MKSTKSIILISLAAILCCALPARACTEELEYRSEYIRIFRCCSHQLEQQWQNCSRFRHHEKEQNCLLWQSITSPSIPLYDIEQLLYASSLADIKALPSGPLEHNKFAAWLCDKKHRDDLDFVLIAKEIEELRSYINDPWYYPYPGDEEHISLADLLSRCQQYKGTRHRDRYALQTIRLLFTDKKYQDCIDLWDSGISSMPQNIITDMIASYVGGAYSRLGNRPKAIELYTRAQDIGSLINLQAWEFTEQKSRYADKRTRELEYILNRFPDSPLLSIKLQEYVRDLEDFVANPEDDFYRELKHLANKTIKSSRCHNKGIWHYALAYLNHLDGNHSLALQHLVKAEQTADTPLLQESVHALRFLLEARQASNNPAYINRLFAHLKWLDEMWQREADPNVPWQWPNIYNIYDHYWQDVACRVLLSEVCPRLDRDGNTTLALQLANYAANRCHQLSPLFAIFCFDENCDNESYTDYISFDQYRNHPSQINHFDYRSQFFRLINSTTADRAARYAHRITHPITELDKFLNERSYTDPDYIADIVGTLYLREMRYREAARWLANVSKSYQARTNIAKDGFFNRDPFRYQSDKPQHIYDPSDYKLKFAQEMVRLEQLIATATDPNRRANAKIRYATGLRNSFGHCWYLTDYYYSLENDKPYSIFDRTRKTSDALAPIFAKVDRLIDEALKEFTDPEQAAQAHLMMKNHRTLLSKYPNSRSAAYIRTHCDTYRDYALHRR